MSNQCLGLRDQSGYERSFWARAIIPNVFPLAIVLANDFESGCPPHNQWHTIREITFYSTIVCVFFLILFIQKHALDRPRRGSYGSLFLGLHLQGLEIFWQGSFRGCLHSSIFVATKNTTRLLSTVSWYHAFDGRDSTHSHWILTGCNMFNSGVWVQDRAGEGWLFPNWVGFHSFTGADGCLFSESRLVESSAGSRHDGAWRRLRGFQMVPMNQQQDPPSQMPRFTGPQWFSKRNSTIDWSF